MSEKPATRSSNRTRTPAVPPPTTTRTTRAKATTTAKAATQPAPAAPAKRTAARKPLADSNNALAAPSSKPASKPDTSRKAAKALAASLNSEREPIMAYLRIRPHLGEDEPSDSPYLTHLSDTSVRMSDPNGTQNNTRIRVSSLPPSSIYKFSHVFPPNTIQSDFFTRTTLPLVNDALNGQNALLFTYGVTNSGKTYTVQGGTTEGSAGILPRTLDVLFNSIQGLHGDGKYRPVRLQGVEQADPSDSKPAPVVPEAALTAVLGPDLDSPGFDHDIDPTVLKVDRNYEYTLWLSYAEVYNEKVYDLLDSVQDGSENETTTQIPRSNSDKTLTLTRKALSLKPSPPSDGIDSTVRGKYISGLRQFRVHSSSQAKALVKLGQLHRRVFGTLANRESSRSHGMVILKIVRCHRGERNDPNALQISRLTLVDLAGSERTKHTHTTGDRLKEAGNINKSLMVLGQCMEVMRSNQRKLAMSLSHEGTGKDGRVDTRDVKKGLAVVPFRHSKLTETLMDYFVGDGRTVMIVNVNPYDTGYDENSHVMKFAALAREVYISPAPAPVHRVPAIGPGKLVGKTIRGLGPLTLNDPDIVPKPFTRNVTISGKKADTVLRVLEVDDTDDGNVEDDDDDEDPINPLVDALFDEVEDLRMQLFESEMRAAIIEAETREEVIQEMEDRMRKMEQRHARRLRQELEQNEAKTDAKIDLLYQSGMFGSPEKKTAARPTYSSDEEDAENSLIANGPGHHDAQSSSSGEDFDFETEGDEDSDQSKSPSPLAAKFKQQVKSSPNKRQSVAPTPVREIREFIPDAPMLPSDSEDAELTGTEDCESMATRSVASETEDSADDYSESESEADWLPNVPAATDKTPKGKAPARRSFVNPPTNRTPGPSSRPDTLNKLGRDLSNLSLDGGVGDDSVLAVPW